MDLDNKVNDLMREWIIFRDEYDVEYTIFLKEEDAPAGSKSSNQENR